ncbi:MAG: DUF4241 domain-containing protein [Agriterribacter sp.]
MKKREIITLLNCIASISIATIVSSCNNGDKEHEYGYGIYGAKLDTLRIQPHTVITKPVLFETAFFYNSTAVLNNIPIHFFQIQIGKLKVETGKLIACDPIQLENFEPFTQQFPTGKFPVQLSIAKIKTDERVAFSQILFSESAVAKWEFALQKGQQPLSIFSDTIYGYGVDAGMGMFIDEKASKAFSLLIKDDQNLWEKIFLKSMHEQYRNTWDFLLYDFQGGNFAAFATGYGDGSYATYIGFDEKGLPCRLLTDFGLVDWAKNKEN